MALKSWDLSRFPEIWSEPLHPRAADYLLKLMAEDTEGFARIHRQFLSRLPGVRQMQTSFVLRTVVRTTALAV